MKDIKTIGEFLDFLIETNNNYENEFFFDYAGNVDAFGLYMYPKGKREVKDAIYYTLLSYVYKKDIPAKIEEMVKWVKENRGAKEPEVEHV